MLTNDGEQRLTLKEMTAKLLELEREIHHELLLECDNDIAVYELMRQHHRQIAGYYGVLMRHSY
jgi:hypothetical protein